LQVSQISVFALVYNKAGNMSCMPPDSPSPQPDSPKRSALTDGIARAERLLEIAFIMPAALAVGWLGGAALDKWLHQHWIYVAGIILGFVAGFIEVIRLAVNYSNKIDKEDRSA
jgi:ATP synthase protein I